MDERKTAESTVKQPIQTDGATALEQAFARGSRPLGEIPSVPSDRTENSVMEGLPPAKAERIAAMRRELAELQRQLIDAQQRIAKELQGRAEDAERFEALEARLQAQEAKVREGATTAEDLRRDVAARDAQIEDARRDHRGVTEQLETQGSLLSETKALLATRDGEIATRTAERDTEQATRSRLERELEDQRKQHGEVTSDLAMKLESLRAANALIATRDAELAALTSERDELKSNLITLTSERDGLKGDVATLTSERDGLKGDVATLTSERDGLRSELVASSAKRREVSDQLARLGHDLMEGVGGNPTVSATSAEPPKAPPPPAAAVTEPPRQVERILDVSEKPKPKSRIALVVLGGILGCVATVAAVKWSSSSSATADERHDVGASPTAAMVSEHPSTPVSPASTSDVTGHPNEQNDTRPVAPPENTTDGVLVLPQEAADHRVFVDGRVVPVKNSRALVPCGTREIRIGSRGTPRMLDVACSGETAVPSDTVE